MIHLYLVENLHKKICVLPILVDLEPAAKLEMTYFQTDLSALVLLVSEETLWYLAPEVNMYLI